MRSSPEKRIKAERKVIWDFGMHDSEQMIFFVAFLEDYIIKKMKIISYEATFTNGMK